MTRSKQTRLTVHASLQNNVATKTFGQPTHCALAIRDFRVALATLIHLIGIALTPAVILSCIVALAKLGKSTKIALALLSNQTATSHALTNHAMMNATLLYFAAKGTTTTATLFIAHAIRENGVVQVILGLPTLSDVNAMKLYTAVPDRPGKLTNIALLAIQSESVVTRNFIIKTTIALATLKMNAVLTKTGTLTQNSVCVSARKNAVMIMAITMVKTQITARALLTNSAAQDRTLVQTQITAHATPKNSAAQDRTLVQTQITAHASPTNSAAQDRTLVQTQLTAYATLTNSAAQDRTLVLTQDTAHVLPTNSAVNKTVQLIDIANVIVNSAVAMGIIGPIHIAPIANH
jgi:hypothetical protein